MYFLPSENGELGALSAIDSSILERDAFSEERKNFGEGLLAIVVRSLLNVQFNSIDSSLPI